MKRAHCPHAFRPGEVNCRNCDWTPDVETGRQILATAGRPVTVLPASWWADGRAPMAVSS